MSVETLIHILRLLPLIVFGWIIINAVMVFSREAGRRDPRGIGIGLSIWGTVALSNRASLAPLWVAGVGVGGLFAALALFHWAAFSIRGRMFSYAGTHDLPQFVHQSGPYAYVRNPFYASYLLGEIATVLIWPTLLGAAVVLLAVLYFEWLARFEEAKFSRSPVAEEYARYKARTGRLVPRILSGTVGNA